jgi:hypothetical protein
MGLVFFFEYHGNIMEYILGILSFMDSPIIYHHGNIYTETYHQTISN